MGADDLITTTTSNANGMVVDSQPCPDSSIQSVKCDDSQASIDAFIQPTTSTVIQTPPVGDSDKSGISSTVISRFFFQAAC
jgi:hypothetical protein